MKVATIQINLYSLHELEETPKETAIQDHSNFLISQGIEIENENGKLENVEYNPSESEVIENIEANDYIFFSNGELADCTTFCGKHPRAGETVFNYRGAEYSI